MSTNNDNKQPKVHLEVRKIGVPGFDEMAARVSVEDGGFVLRGEFYRTQEDELGLRFERALAEKDEYRQLAAMVVSLYEDLFAKRAVRYEGMDRSESVVAYLKRVFDERADKRRARLLAAETRAYPNSSRPYTVHLRHAYKNSWSVSAYAEGERSQVAQARIDVSGRKAKLSSVDGYSGNCIWAEAGVCAIERAWKENAIVLLESSNSPRGVKASLKRVRMRDHCLKAAGQKTPAATASKARKAA